MKALIAALLLVAAAAPASADSLLVAPGDSLRTLDANASSLNFPPSSFT
jgi:hypothetical protein